MHRPLGRGRSRALTVRASKNAPELAHVLAVLARSPLFGVLPEDTRQTVAGAFEWCYAPGGQAVLGPGDPPEAVFLVVHGRLRVFWDLDASGRVDVSEATSDVSEGGVVGDIGMLSDAPHRGLVVAVRDTELGRLPKDRLWALALQFPELARRLGQHAVQRLQAAFRPPIQVDRVNVALVPVDADAPLRRFASALATELETFDRLLYVNAERFDAELGTGAHDDDVDQWDETDRRVVRWICAQERTHRFILYEADPNWTPWTRRCVRMADRLLIVARAAASPEPTRAEREVFAQHTNDLVPSELVLLHDDDAPLPSGTLRWLVERPHLKRVHHVKLGSPASLQRLARFLSGRAIGVVLGGGGARNAAQIGAVQALRDAGIPIDLVGGSSAGAGVAAMVALGWDLPTMERQNRRAFVGMAPFSHFSFPYYSMIRRTRVEEVARFLYDGTRIEDLWIEFFCLSCDLVAGKPVVHRQGELWRAVLATTALPGVLPPMLWDGRLLVDGGVFDNNPVAQMRTLTSGPVVTVDVSHVTGHFVDPPGLVQLPANAMALWHRFKPFGRRLRVPTIPEIVVRTMTIGRPDLDIDRASDLYVRPDVGRFGLTDFESQDELVAIGYDAVMSALERRADDPVFLARFGLAAEAIRSLPRMRAPGADPPDR